MVWISGLLYVGCIWVCVCISIGVIYSCEDWYYAICWLIATSYLKTSYLSTPWLHIYCHGRMDHRSSLISCWEPKQVSWNCPWSYPDIQDQRVKQKVAGRVRQELEHLLLFIWQYPTTSRALECRQHIFIFASELAIAPTATRSVAHTRNPNSGAYKNTQLRSITESSCKSQARQNCILYGVQQAVLIFPFCLITLHIDSLTGYLTCWSGIPSTRRSTRGCMHAWPLFHYFSLAARVRRKCTSARYLSKPRWGLGKIKNKIYFLFLTFLVMLYCTPWYIRLNHSISHLLPCDSPGRYAWSPSWPVWPRGALSSLGSETR